MPFDIEIASTNTLVNTLYSLSLIAFGWVLKTITDRASEKQRLEHRLRVEKEYEIYSNLWDKLFEVRRAVGALTNPIDNPGDAQYRNNVRSIIDAYQSIVRKGEPFMKLSVYEPAREIVRLARRIIGAIDDKTEIGKLRTEDVGTPTDMKYAEQQKEFRMSANAAFGEIDQLFEQVKQAIRQRVSP